MIEFTVFGKAEPAGSKRAFVMPKTGRAVVVDANSKAKPWKAQVAAEAAEAMGGRELLDGALLLDVSFFLPKPKSVKRRYPTVKPDVTKLLRGVEDAMTGIVYRDDSQIVVQVASKHYGEPARTLIRVTPQLPGDGDESRAGSTDRRSA